MTMHEIDVVFFDIGGTLGKLDASTGKLIPFPNSAEVLQTVRDLMGLRVGIITTLDSRFTNADILELLRDAGLVEYLDPDGFVSNHDAGVAKPEAEIYRFAAHQVNVASDRCLYVGEDLKEVIGAITAGMKAVLNSQPSD